MSLHLIENNEGIPAGVFIPIDEWINLKKQYKDLESLELVNNNVLKELKIAIEELKDIEFGNLKARKIDELIDEL